MQYEVADLNRIRDRLLVLGHEAQKRLDRRQGPSHEQAPEPARPAATGANSAPAEVQAPLEPKQAGRERQRTLAEVEQSAQQARMERDYAHAELRAAQRELREVRAELEIARAREQELATAGAEATRSNRRGMRLRAEKRIAELEGELETERELRQDFELALQLLEQQQAKDTGRTDQDTGRTDQGRNSSEEPVPAPEPQPPSAAEPPLPEPAPTGPEPDGWGVPLEAFPVDPGGPGDPADDPRAAAPRGRRSRLRPRGRFNA